MDSRRPMRLRNLPYRLHATAIPRHLSRIKWTEKPPRPAQFILVRDGAFLNMNKFEAGVKSQWIQIIGELESLPMKAIKSRS